ncbi:MAG: hypothetical protein Q9193_004886 [Seirophora villosa]
MAETDLWLLKDRLGLAPIDDAGGFSSSHSTRDKRWLPERPVAMAASILGLPVRPIV